MFTPHVPLLVNSFLFGVSATDPFVYAAAAVTMMVMALLASALPALRAATADALIPNIILKRRFPPTS